MNNAITCKSTFNETNPFEFTTFKGQSVIAVCQVLADENLVLLPGPTADMLTDANLFLLHRALLLNLRMQKQTIVCFEFTFDLLILWQTLCHGHQLQYQWLS